MSRDENGDTSAMMTWGNYYSMRPPVFGYRQLRGRVKHWATRRFWRIRSRVHRLYLKALGGRLWPHEERNVKKFAAFFHVPESEFRAAYVKRRSEPKW